MRRRCLPLAGPAHGLAVHHDHCSFFDGAGTRTEPGPQAAFTSAGSRSCRTLRMVDSEGRASLASTPGIAGRRRSGRWRAPMSSSLRDPRFRLSDIPSRPNRFSRPHPPTLPTPASNSELSYRAEISSRRTRRFHVKHRAHPPYGHEAEHQRGWSLIDSTWGGGAAGADPPQLGRTGRWEKSGENDTPPPPPRPPPHECS